MIPISPRASIAKQSKRQAFACQPGSVERLEAAVCDYHDCRFAVAFHSPQSAAAAAFAAAGVTRDDSVVTGAMGPDYQYAALSQIGAVPRFCEIDLNGNLNARSLTALTAGGIRAVLLNHFEGIRALLPERPANITVIEDSAASLAPVHAAGTLTLWSMSEVMPEGAAPTGFVLTDDADTAEKVRRYRNGGRKAGSRWNYDIPAPGIDAGLGEPDASIALEQIGRLTSACERRRENIAQLDAAFAANRLVDRVRKTPEDDLRTYPLLLTPPLYCPKEDIYDAIRESGIEVTVCCKPVYKTTAYKDESVRLPVTEDFYKAFLQLPCHHLLNDKEIEQVAGSLLKAVETFGYRGCRF